MMETCDEGVMGHVTIHNERRHDSFEARDEAFLRRVMRRMMRLDKTFDEPDRREISYDAV